MIEESPFAGARANLVALAAFGALLFLAACSPEQKEAARIRWNLVDPTIYVDASVAGTTVTLDRGQALVLRLEENPSTGYRWVSAMPKTDTVIAPVRRDFTSGRAGTTPFAPDQNTTQPTSGPPAIMPGVPGEATFRYRGVDAGSTPVTLEYRRAWEPGAPAKTVAFEVVVR